MAFFSDLMTNYGYVKPKNVQLNRHSNLSEYRQVVERLGFTDYYHEFFFPYYRDSYPDMSRDEFIESMSLTSIEEYLRSAEKITVMHNEDDIILLPGEIERYGIEVSSDMDQAVDGADVVMMLRVQFERQEASCFPSKREYFRCFGLTEARLARASKNAIVMHPGPMNRGVEISSAVADGEQSVILEQVANGVAVRMAALFLVFGGVDVPAEERS